MIDLILFHISIKVLVATGGDHNKVHAVAVKNRSAQVNSEGIY